MFVKKTHTFLGRVMGVCVCVGGEGGGEVLLTARFAYLYFPSHRPLGVRDV